MRKTNDVSVEIGEGVATVFRRGRTQAIVANVLGVDRDAAGRSRYWLDRLVHTPAETNMGEGVECFGAITSVLVITD